VVAVAGRLAGPKKQQFQQAAPKIIDDHQLDTDTSDALLSIEMVAKKFSLEDNVFIEQAAKISAN
jgi:hypothetical protein